MKKYNAPVFEVEVFETSDVITVSAIIAYDTKNNADGFKTVDYNDLP